jgi:hypothetical protein
LATVVILSDELAVYGQPLLAASGQTLMAAHTRQERDRVPLKCTYPNTAAEKALAASACMPGSRCW